jgi:hypothetical protein
MLILKINTLNVTGVPEKRKKGNQIDQETEGEVEHREEM